MAEQEMETDMFGNASLFDEFFEEPVSKQEVEQSEGQEDETSCQMKEKIEELQRENILLFWCVERSIERIVGPVTGQGLFCLLFV